jgi:hypothetical protein
MNQYKIASLWDGTKLPESEQVSVMVNIEMLESKEACLMIDVEAPFFNDVKPASDADMNLDGLWNFEVVEVFIKGRHDKYIEIEMGPHGHFLILACDGYRQCFTRRINPISYVAKISSDSSRWTAKMVCSIALLPPPTEIAGAEYSFNAYSIHNKPGVRNPQDHNDRVHAAVFVPLKAEGEYEIPDFHKLELFDRFSTPLMIDAVCPASIDETSVWGERRGRFISMGNVHKDLCLDVGEESPRLRE